jgi:hypothetical protein
MLVEVEAHHACDVISGVTEFMVDVADPVAQHAFNPTACIQPIQRRVTEFMATACVQSNRMQPRLPFHPSLPPNLFHNCIGSSAAQVQLLLPLMYGALPSLTARPLATNAAAHASSDARSPPSLAAMPLSLSLATNAAAHASFDVQCSH